jgi:serine/threonine protein kinase
VLEKEIGRGEFGVVMKAVGLNVPMCDETQAVAVKVLHEGSAESDTNSFIREAMRARELDHPNVVRLLGVCFAENPLFIVLEYMPHGDLKNVLRRYNALINSLSLNHLMSFVVDVSRGVSYLQKMRFVHRDLAARNVLVNAAMQCKIGDFGMARRTYRSEYYSATGASLMAGSLVLPMRWMAPESYFDGTWDLASDMWMYGVLLWGMRRYIH